MKITLQEQKETFKGVDKDTNKEKEITYIAYYLCYGNAKIKIKSVSKYDKSKLGLIADMSNDDNE